MNALIEKNVLVAKNISSTNPTNNLAIKDKMFCVKLAIF